MKFEDAMVALRGGKKICFGNTLPFDFDNIPALTPADYARDDFEIYAAPLTDEELVAAMEREAAQHEREAEEREAKRLKDWEAAVEQAKDEGKSDNELPTKPRAARSSIAQTLRRAAQSIRTRQYVSEAA